MIIVLGSLNADMVFSVARLPRPGETVIGGQYRLVPGGKGGNQAVAAARAGAATRMVGRVGEDGAGDFLIESLRGAGVDVGAVGRSPAATGCAAISVDPQGQNQITVAAGANLTARAAQVPNHWLGPGATVMLQMEVTPGENWVLAAEAHEAGARVFLNAAPAAPVPKTAMRFLDVLLVNEIESVMVAEAAGLAETEPVEAARGLAGKFELTCIVTLGGDGAVAWRGDEEWSIGALDIAPVDTTAAGDAFAGSLAASMDGGAELPEALRRASVAGGLACLKQGAQTSLPSAANIARHLHDLEPARKSSR